jgi:hypothetical protein
MLNGPIALLTGDADAAIEAIIRTIIPVNISLTNFTSQMSLALYRKAFTYKK